VKKTVATIAASMAMVGLSTATAFAWTYGVSGKGVCQPNGSYVITWSVDNNTESQPLHITASSNAAVVPAGTNVAAKSVKNYTQTVDGTKATNYSLSLSGNWDGDKTVRDRTASVNLDKACTQPTGGKGGGDTTTPSTPVTPAAATVTAAPAVVPAGPVNAGEGGADKTVSLAALAGLVSSLAVLALGIVRRVQRV
jgi:hypothetical protein